MKKPGLRFAMITTFYPPYHFGGDAIYVQRFARALARRGHEVDVIHDRDAFHMLSHDPADRESEEVEGVRVYGLRSRHGSLSCLLTQQSGRPLMHGGEIDRILRERQPDVIHYHNISLVGGPGVLAYGDAIKVYTAHEHWLVCPSHILWRHNREVCTGRQCLRCVLGNRRPPQLWRYTGLLADKGKHVDAFCALSEFSAQKHKEFGFPFDMRVVSSFLPDAGEIDPAAYEDPDLPRDRPFFLFVGRMEKIKGVQDLIPVFQQQDQYNLVLVGGGEYEAELHKQAKAAPRIHFLGRRTPEQLRNLYALATAVVMPSICYEVFPLVALEAFREGTPIIARRLGPYPEIVEQSGGGLLFENESELVQAIQRLGGNANYRDQLGQAAYQAFQQRWSEGPSLSEYFELLKSLASRKGNTRIQNALSDGQA